MKAVIFAGSLYTRVVEEANLKPKLLVEIGGKPITLEDVWTRNAVLWKVLS